MINENFIHQQTEIDILVAKMLQKNNEVHIQTNNQLTMKIAEIEERLENIVTGI